MVDADFLTGFGIGCTAAGMIGTEEGGDAIARLFLLVVTSDRAARPQVNSSWPYGRFFCTTELAAHR